MFFFGVKGKVKRKRVVCRRKRVWCGEGVEDGEKMWNKELKASVTWVA